MSVFFHRTISGLVKPRTGTVEFEGAPLPRKPSKIVGAGVEMCIRDRVEGDRWHLICVQEGVLFSYLEEPRTMLVLTLTLHRKYATISDGNFKETDQLGFQGYGTEFWFY